MTHLSRLASLIYNRPLLVHPNTAAVIDAALGARFGTDGTPDLSALAPEASRFRGTPDANGMRYRVEGGTAIIPVLGELCNRGAWIGASSGLTSYEGIAAQLAAAGDDPAVEDVVLDMNTPGGEAVGAFECAAEVRALAAKKPVVAFVNGMAASAGYALASGADRIVVTPSGIVGSIGVVMMHLDQSKRLERAGVAVTLIYAGDHKVDGNPFGPLPDNVKADLKAEVGTFYGMFVDTVAQGRGMEAGAVRSTEARCFMGAEAVAAGLADEVGTLDGVLASLQSARSTGAFNPGEIFMTTVSEADHNAALSAAREEGTKAAAAAATAAQVRIAAIIGAPEAKGRETTAQHLAFKTDMSAEAAIATLATMPEAAAPKESRMTRTPNPDVRPDGPGAEGPDHAAMWSDAVSAVNKAAGVR